jgi:hypothetical protein
VLNNVKNVTVDDGSELFTTYFNTPTRKASKEH